MHHLPDLKGTARRIRARRVELGISQRELAFDGCSYAYISRVEAATRTPSRQVLIGLARRLGTTEHFLVYGIPDPVERGLLAGGLTLAALTEEEREQLEEEVDAALHLVARAFAITAKIERLQADEASARDDSASGKRTRERRRQSMPDELTCPACGRGVAPDDREGKAYRRVEVFVQAPHLLAIQALGGGATAAGEKTYYVVDDDERELCAAWLARLVDEQGNPIDDWGRTSLEWAADGNSGKVLVAEKIVELTETVDYYDQDDVRTKMAEIRKLARRGLYPAPDPEFTGVRLIPADEHSADVWRATLDGQMLAERPRAEQAAEQLVEALNARRAAREQAASDVKP
jgi:transcriptional regulator with XRE-family HTH domain